MDDFKNFTPKNTSSTDMNAAMDMAKSVIGSMNGKSESQLLRTIIAEAERGKREGRLSNADLDNFYNSVAPMVDGAKRKKLKEIISRLKSI